MFIGHLPAGYLASRLLFPRFETTGVLLKPYLWAGLLGAITPDLDMLYFYLIDHRQHHHHTYLTHYPIIWISLLLISLAWLSLTKTKQNGALATIFSINGLIHLCLDSIVGDIWWFAPLLDRPFAFFTVPALYKPWWLNFLLHWSFALELTLLALSIWLWQHHPPRHSIQLLNKGA